MKSQPQTVFWRATSRVNFRLPYKMPGHYAPLCTDGWRRVRMLMLGWQFERLQGLTRHLGYYRK